MIDMTQSIRDLDNRDISDNLFQYDYNTKHLLSLINKGIEFDDTKIPLADLQKKHGFNLIIDKVEGIDANKKPVNKDRNITFFIIFYGNKVKLSLLFLAQQLFV